MSAENLRTGSVRPYETSDPRDTLVREKYFSLRPKPLEKWLWEARSPGSAERVFWYHWDIGHQNGSWVSQVPLRIVAKECGLDVATVTRAYQWLKARGLLRRVDAGRDDANPFRQATALTEVFVPRDLVKRLASEPNRRRGEGKAAAASPARAAAQTPRPAELPSASIAPATAAPVVSRNESRAILQKLSDGERNRLYAAQRDRRTEVEFDADSRLTELERAHVLHTVRLIAAARPASAPPTTSMTSRPRVRLSVLQLAETRARIRKAKGEGDARDVQQLLREVAWSVEEGALARFEPTHALAIACKKIREGAWSTPFRMPVDWSWKRALPESCSAAGGN
jgi:hypothetical protein